MTVSIKIYVPFVAKALPETLTGVQRLSKQTDKCIHDLKVSGLRIMAVASDAHSSDVTSYSVLLKKFRGGKKLFIYRPVFSSKLLFDIVYS